MHSAHLGLKTDTGKQWASRCSQTGYLTGAGRKLIPWGGVFSACKVAIQPRPPPTLRVNFHVARNTDNKGHKVSSYPYPILKYNLNTNTKLQTGDWHFGLTVLFVTFIKIECISRHKGHPPRGSLGAFRLKWFFSLTALCFRPWFVTICLCKSKQWTISWFLNKS